MEVNEVRRGGRVISAGTPAGKKTGTGLSAGRPSRADKVALSMQAVAYLEEQNRQRWEQTSEKKESSAQEGLLKKLDKDLKKMDKCQKIYARVANGDKVPPEDLYYLEKCDPEGFKLALAMRRPSKHPKEWKSELDDEDRKELMSGEISEVKPESKGAPSV